MTVSSHTRLQSTTLAQAVQASTYWQTRKPPGLCQAGSFRPEVCSNSPTAQKSLNLDAEVVDIDYARCNQATGRSSERGRSNRSRSMLPLRSSFWRSGGWV